MHSPQAIHDRTDPKAKASRAESNLLLLPLFPLTSHINGGIHMQRMFFLPYSQKSLRLQRMGRRAKLQNLSCFTFKILSLTTKCAYTEHEALDSSESSRSRQSLSIYLLSGFSVPLHQTQTIVYPSIQRLAPITWREKVRSCQCLLHAVRCDTSHFLLTINCCQLHRHHIINLSSKPRTSSQWNHTSHQTTTPHWMQPLRRNKIIVLDLQQLSTQSSCHLVVRCLGGAQTALPIIRPISVKVYRRPMLVAWSSRFMPVCSSILRDQEE